MGLEIIEIIEDDPDQASLIDREIRKAGYRTNVAHDGKTGLEDIRRLRPSLVLLDVMLPDMDGHNVCRCLREDRQTERIPIIMISALGSEEHKTAGLELGADDYVVKPYSLAEVISRVRAILRRARIQAGPQPAAPNSDLLLQEDQYVALFRGQRVILTGPEWKILHRLVGSTGRVVLREELIGLIWGQDGLIHEHELDRYVRTLREKLGDAAVTPTIVVPSATGYLLTARRPEIS